ncbi:MAG: protein phosphatase 2C domain-containing protein [Lachnospiraceae bacterium]|nr:protein phosphatase 2C domain-containing protein [Lachnospiraceae bacterium]
MKVTGEVYRDRGERIRNEDSLLFCVLRAGRKRIVLAAVADGIGSLDLGAEAGSFVLERLRSGLYHTIVPAVNRKKGFSLIRRCMLRELIGISMRMREYGREEKVSFGTTLSMILIVGRRYLAINLGDSLIFRAFWRSKGRLIPLCRPDRNPDGSLSSGIGSFPVPKLFMKTGYLTGKSVFLIASDGFHTHLSGTEHLFSPELLPDEEAMGRRLKEAGRRIRKSGEKDNASAILFRVG